jgi:hypothetical protein
MRFLYAPGTADSKPLSGRNCKSYLAPAACGAERDVGYFAAMKEIQKSVLRLAAAGAAFWLCAARCAEETQDFRIDSAGARYGIPAGRSGLEFDEAEGFALWQLPWRWDWRAGWRLDTLLDTAAGWLGDGKDAAKIAVGPELVLRRKKLPVFIEAGFSPSVLTRHEFVTKDFGSLIQFTSNAGIGVDLGAHFRLDYRFEHMSNGGFTHPNPGLNLHMVGASYRF